MQTICIILIIFGVTFAHTQENFEETTQMTSIQNDQETTESENINQSSNLNAPEKFVVSHNDLIAIVIVSVVLSILFIQLVSWTIYYYRSKKDIGHQSLLNEFDENVISEADT